MTLDNTHNPLCEHVKKSMKDYFSQLDGQEVTGLYAMVINEVEKPLLECVLDMAKSNQSKAAKMLGISRGTLRKKLAEHQLED